LAYATAYAIQRHYIGQPLVTANIRGHDTPYIGLVIVRHWLLALFGWSILLALSLRHTHCWHTPSLPLAQLGWLLLRWYHWYWLLVIIHWPLWLGHLALPSLRHWLRRIRGYGIGWLMATAGGHCHWSYASTLLSHCYVIIIMGYVISWSYAIIRHWYYVTRHISHHHYRLPRRYGHCYTGVYYVITLLGGLAC